MGSFPGFLRPRVMRGWRPGGSGIRRGRAGTRAGASRPRGPSRPGQSPLAGVPAQRSARRASCGAVWTGSRSWPGNRLQLEKEKKLEIKALLAYSPICPLSIPPFLHRSVLRSSFHTSVCPSAAVLVPSTGAGRVWCIPWSPGSNDSAVVLPSLGPEPTSWGQSKTPSSNGSAACAGEPRGPHRGAARTLLCREPRPSASSVLVTQRIGVWRECVNSGNKTLRDVITSTNMSVYT